MKSVIYMCDHNYSVWTIFFIQFRIYSQLAWYHMFTILHHVFNILYIYNRYVMITSFWDTAPWLNIVYQQEHLFLHLQHLITFDRTHFNILHLLISLILRSCCLTHAKSSQSHKAHKVRVHKKHPCYLIRTGIERRPLVL